MLRMWVSFGVIDNCGLGSLSCWFFFCQNQIFARDFDGDRVSWRLTLDISQSNFESSLKCGIERVNKNKAIPFSSQTNSEPANGKIINPKSSPLTEFKPSRKSHQLHRLVLKKHLKNSHIPVFIRSRKGWSRRTIFIRACIFSSAWLEFLRFMLLSGNHLCLPRRYPTIFDEHFHPQTL